MSQINIILIPSPPAEWSERNVIELRSFIAGDTGSKFLAHQRQIFQSMLNEAINEGQPEVALHKMATAKGFAAALASLESSADTAVPLKQEEPEEEKKKELASNARFATIISRPTIFK